MSAAHSLINCPRNWDSVSTNSTEKSLSGSYICFSVDVDRQRAGDAETIRYAHTNLFVQYRIGCFNTGADDSNALALGQVFRLGDP